MTDDTGQPLEGALVTLTDTKTKEKTTFFTKKDGRYHFEDLSFRIDYSVQARFKDKASEPRKLSQYDHSPETGAYSGDQHRYKCGRSAHCCCQPDRTASKTITIRLGEERVLHGECLFVGGVGEAVIGAGVRSYTAATSFVMSMAVSAYTIGTLGLLVSRTSE